MRSQVLNATLIDPACLLCMAADIVLDDTLPASRSAMPELLMSSKPQRSTQQHGEAVTWTSWLRRLGTAQLPLNGSGVWEGRCWYHDRDNGHYDILCVPITDVRLLFNTTGPETGSTHFTGSGYDEFGRFAVHTGELKRSEGIFIFESRGATGGEWTWEGVATNFGLVGSYNLRGCAGAMGRFWLWKKVEGVVSGRGAVDMKLSS